MIYPEGDILKERVRNRYSLVVLASKRAKQIKEGAPVLIDTSSTNHLTIALEEIAAGKVSYSEHMESVEDDESPSTFSPAMDFGSPEAEFDTEFEAPDAPSTDATESPEAEEVEAPEQAEEPEAAVTETDAEEALDSSGEG